MWSDTSQDDLTTFQGRKASKARLILKVEEFTKTKKVILEKVVNDIEFEREGGHKKLIGRVIACIDADFGGRGKLLNS